LGKNPHKQKLITEKMEMNLLSMNATRVCEKNKLEVLF